MEKHKKPQAFIAPDLALLTAVLDSLPDYIWICDAALRETIYISLACERLLGVQRQGLLGDCRKLMRVVHEADRRKLFKARRQAGLSGYNETYRIVRPDGSVRWIQDRAFLISGDSGSGPRVAGIAVDVTDRKRTEQQLVELAYFDALTQLPNRTLFYDRLARIIAHARRYHSIVGVLFVDIDSFKGVNDSFGHAAGDELLKQIAKRLETCMRGEDTVGRLSGDEFAVVLSKVASAADAAIVAKKILELLSVPFSLNGTEVRVTASVGITLYPGDSLDCEGLVKNADVAMYKAKSAGRNNHQFYVAPNA